MTGICLVLEHEIIDLTKTVATLDELSGGRLLLGVGVGWNREELANVSSVPWSKRYSALRESIAAMRALWAEDEAGYEGEHVHVAPSWVFPKPTRRTGTPILMGCQGRVGLAPRRGVRGRVVPPRRRLPGRRQGPQLVP